MDVVKKCEAAWYSATSDTERFAALLVIAKLIKESNVSDLESKEIFETIGFSFLNRLFVSEAQEECPAKIFKSVGCAILSQFCTVPELASKEEICNFIPILNEMLCVEEINPDDEKLYEDILHCFMAMVVHETCRQCMINKGSVPILVHYYCISSQQEALQILKFLLLGSEMEMTENNQLTLNKLLEKISQQFFSDRSEEKFELCQFIFSVLIKWHNFQLKSDTASVIRDTLTEILCNKLRKDHRDVTIKLSSVMVEKFGSRWFTDDNRESEMFFVVLVQIICVEIRMILEDRTLQEVVSEGLLLTACYSILETVISTMVGENWFQTNQQYAEQLLTSIKMAFEAILSFLKTASLEWNSSISHVTDSPYRTEEVIIATVRILCSWLAEESFVLYGKVCEILPFVLTLCKKSFQKMLLDNTKNIDLLRFLVSPLCHLTADDKSRKVLIQNGLLQLLFEYMGYQWNVFQNSASLDIEILLTTLCGILLNIVVLEFRIVSENEDFFTFLKFLFSILPQLSSDLVHLTLKANFSVLGLLITKQCYKKVTSCETSFYRFLSASIKFLWDTHHVEEENGSTSFVITRQYREVWSDIMELWFLGMQALSTVIPLMPWIARFIVESGWPKVIIESLLKVNTKGIEASVKSAYQAFLCTLVRVCKTAALLLVECNAIAVCQKHELQELECLLSNFTDK